jgi:hypothetical protein
MAYISCRTQGTWRSSTGALVCREAGYIHKTQYALFSFCSVEWSSIPQKPVSIKTKSSCIFYHDYYMSICSNPKEMTSTLTAPIQSIYKLKAFHMRDKCVISSRKDPEVEGLNKLNECGY